MRLFSSILLSLFFAPVFGQRNAPDSILISGEISLTTGWRPRLYLVKPLNYRQLISSYEGAVVDSADISPDGSFRFLRKNLPSGKALFRLSIQQKKTRWQNAIEPPYQENYVVLALGSGSKIHLTAQSAQFARTCKLQVSDTENDAIAGLRQLREPIFSQSETDLALRQEGEDPNIETTLHPDKITVERVAGKREADRKVQRNLKVFLDSTRMLAPGFVALQYLNPLAEYNRDVDFFVRLGHRWSAFEAGPFADWVAAFRQRLERFHPALMVGDTLPDFAAATEAGDSIRFSALPGKLKMVYFWRAGRGPGRAVQREVLLSLYQEFNARGFEILGYSVDYERDVWAKAIREDNLPWPNVHDPRGIRADILFEFDIKNYPEMILADAAGKVVARGLEGEELREFVRRFFEK